MGSDLCKKKTVIRHWKRFKNKVALVTGGSSGIGRAIARRLCDEGATVITAQRGKDEGLTGSRQISRIRIHRSGSLKKSSI
ncbi:SDR family NAD(P)-dependent oxidoreductase [Salibacterium salarium]|uniref:SDR family NAD(P)-dependent oxidoreductase n=1 Tax=Salibacterium salarium TaxID=284579 RepID=UPI002482B616|nr:SDR family NAD(P)-dependent oxidoreductase [Salibacterium salarium]